MSNFVVYPSLWVRCDTITMVSADEWSQKQRIVVLDFGFIGSRPHPKIIGRNKRHPSYPPLPIDTSSSFTVTYVPFSLFYPS
jgi:hypothetical protein